MAKRPMFGKAFSGSSVERILPARYTRVTHVPKHMTRIEKTQDMSLRKRKGIKPSLPRFSWDEPEPEPPPPPDHSDALRKIELQLDGCESREIDQETETHLIVSMLNTEGKPFTACWCKKNGCITWLEGKNKPAKRLRNGPPKRKDN